ncbi:MAG: NADH-quinone oxidoreductase subunit L [Verrucomicrobia bacterium]|nr:NADH-quinone oxidoreductase subunit L [Verrucomicrobiota bacterium]
MFDDFKPEDVVWIILFLPLLAAAAIGLFTKRDGKFSAQLSISAVVLTFLVSCGVFLMFKQTVFDTKLVTATPLNWLHIGELKVDIGLRLDPLSLLMLLVVTGVGAMIHIYSYGYMKEDRCMGRYFGSLSVFMFSMLGIVLANNFVMMFIFWELVGVSSYLLIGFWYEKPSAADACKKAFITNRLGDFGFILGIILVWATLGSVNFDELQQRLLKAPEAWGGVAALAGFLIFCGAMGKSAQFPLHVWLPDAMEGPTPVSALIHAATMVAAGVYMLCRVFFLFGAHSNWPAPLAFLNGVTALDLIAWIGGFTALIAALMAVQQNDIKRILAYSTLSQLGYMVMAVGLTGPTAAMYHLTTHAFFKALLFLGAGSVIYGCHHEQDIWKMGGLNQKMKITWLTFLIGTLALCGVPPFSGFFSKDDILAQAAQHSALLFILATLVAFLTTFYMFRLVFVAFTGGARSEAAGHAHESPKVMVWPLVVLAVPSTLAGFWGIDRFIGRNFGGDHAATTSWLDQLFAPFNHSPLAALFGLLATIVGFSLAYTFYAKAENDPLPEKLGALSRAMRNRFYFDEIYEWLIAATHELVSRLAEFVDRWFIAGLGVRGAHGTTELIGRALRLAQSGNLQTYAFLFVAGLVVVIWFSLK